MLQTKILTKRFFSCFSILWILLLLSGCVSEEIPCSQNDKSLPCNQEHTSVELVDDQREKDSKFFFYL